MLPYSYWMEMMVAEQPRKTSSHSSASALSHVDIGQHMRNISVPSLAATLTIPHSFSPQTPRRIEFAGTHSALGSTTTTTISAGAGAGISSIGIGRGVDSRNVRQVSQSTTSNPTSSPSSAERDRILRLQQRRRQGKRREAAHTHGILSTGIVTTPPPRRSSRRKTRLVGFNGIVNAKDILMAEDVHHLTEVSDRIPSAQDQRNSKRGQSFLFDKEQQNLAELDGSLPIAHEGDRSTKLSDGQAQNVTPKKRQRHSNRGPGRKYDESARYSDHLSLQKPLYADADDLILDAAPPPSVSSTSLQRQRLHETLIPPAPRHYSRTDDFIPQPRTYNAFATQLYIISYLIFFSILGTLARLGLEWLNFYPGAPLNLPVLWANFGGSLFLGFLLEDRNLFIQGWGRDHERYTAANSLEKAYEQHVKVKKTLPLYIGLAIGFCGSFTSFSSFLEDAFLAMSNDLPVPQSHPYPSGFEIPKSSMTIARSAGYSICALLAVLILTITVSLAAVKIGAHLATFLSPYTPTIPFNFMRKYIDKIFVPLAWLTWIGSLIITIVPPDRPGGPLGKSSWAEESWRQITLACLFSPLGCLLRYYLAIKLNGVMGSFPLGTFCANIFGTAILGMAFDLNHVAMGLGSDAGVGGGLIGCQVLLGVMNGFCGALTTVSTWATEILALGRRAYLYGFVTVATALALLIAIMGSVRWSVGWQEPVCSNVY